MKLQRFVLSLLLTAPLSLPLQAEDAIVHVDLSTAPQPALHQALLDLDRHGHGPLDAAALAKYKVLIAQYGWPTVPAVGLDGVDATGDLLVRASADYAFQNAVENAIQRNRLGIDINRQAFAMLNDRIEVAHGNPQQLGSLLALKGGKVVTSPPVSAAEANPLRDQLGLPTMLGESIAQVQAAVDHGVPFAQASAPPPLAMAPHPPTDPALAAELQRMVDADQAAREAYIQSGMKAGSPDAKRMTQVDASNLVRIKAIFAKEGFPDAAVIGRKGVYALFLLVQHAVADPTLQARALTLAEPLMRKGDMRREDYALLVDRVRVEQGKPQVYGSQMNSDTPSGKWQFAPIEDAAHVDQRRVDMGLSPLAEYAREIQAAYHLDYAIPLPANVPIASATH